MSEELPEQDHQVQAAMAPKVLKPSERVDNRTPNWSVRFTNIALFGWMIALLLVGAVHYLDVYAPYREIGRFPKEEVEAYGLLTAAIVTFVDLPIVVAAIFLVRERRVGKLRIVAGFVLNFFLLVAILFAILHRAVMSVMHV